jgi:hypothetical protein
MTSIVADQNHIEDEQLGETTLELVAIRYTGPNTSLAVTNHLNNEGSWPSMATLQGCDDGPGPWYYALVPDEGLAHLENRPDVDVLYATDRERFAKALLDERRLPENALGTRANPDLRERVFDALGLVPEREGGLLREQLREIAGVDAAEDDGEDDTGLEQQLLDEYDRGELGDICKELRADADEFNLQENQSKTARAEFVAAADKDQRAAAISAATADEDTEESADDSGGDD